MAMLNPPVPDPLRCGSNSNGGSVVFILSLGLRRVGRSDDWLVRVLIYDISTISWGALSTITGRYMMICDDI